MIPYSLIRSASTLIALGLASTVAFGRTPPATPTPPACRTETLRGRVSAGQHYEAAVTPSLVFRLDAENQPRNPPGWTIRITPPERTDADYAMVATPPYRFANPRYLHTGYGVTAAEALAFTPRTFAFVVSLPDYEAAREALNVLLWSGNHSEEQIQAARDQLGSLPTYPGTLWIEDGAASLPDSAHPLGRIERMAFRADLCVPLEQPGATGR